MRFDAVVIGSGLCGTLAARQLEQAGQRVLVLEAGPGAPKQLPGDVVGFQRAVAPLTKIDALAWGFRAPRDYEWHRVRARGGRTLVWGGWMERPPADYFAMRRKLGAPWPQAFDGLAPWLARAETMLSVRGGRPGALHRTLRRHGVEAGVKRESVLLGQRRMLTAVDLPLRAKVRCETTVLRLEPDGDGWVVHLAKGAAVKARRVVLAASPIETARIVEASVAPAQRRTKLEVFDHLIAGAIAIADRQEVTPHPKTAAEPSAVVHPAPGAKARFSLEVRGPTPLEALDEEDLAALGFTKAQALEHSFYVVFAMGETDPRVPRQVLLDEAHLDGLGRPMPRFVKRRHTPYEAALAAKMNARVLGLGRKLATSSKQAFLIYDATDFSSGGHEVGTCLGRVDDRGEVTTLPGVFIVDGSGVPAATDRHPSLTLAANTLRIVSGLCARA